jgi:hypothetical protein
MSDLEFNAKSAQQVFQRRSYFGLPSHAIVGAYIDGGGDERVSVSEDKELCMGVRKRFGKWMNYNLSE